MQQISMLIGTQDNKTCLQTGGAKSVVYREKRANTTSRIKLNKSRLIEKKSMFFLTRGTSVFFDLLVFRSTHSLLRCTALKSVRFSAKLH